jgi:hypothetical protein
MEVLVAFVHLGQPGLDAACDLARIFPPPDQVPQHDFPRSILRCTSSSLASRSGSMG